jgi:hypothetical protein
VYYSPAQHSWVVDHQSTLFMEDLFYHIEHQTDLPDWCWTLLRGKEDEEEVAGV